MNKISLVLMPILTIIGAIVSAYFLSITVPLKIILWVQNRKKNAQHDKSEKNPAHFCDCGEFLGHRGFCSDKCHNKHYSEDSA